MKTLKMTMEENNKYLINKIDTKMETMCMEFQTQMMRFTHELVQNLQANKKPPSNSVTRLSQVYDEETNSVARSDVSHNNSNQVQAQPQNRQNNFPEYPNPFLPSQMISQAS